MDRVVPGEEERLSASTPNVKKGTRGPVADSLATLYERRWLLLYFIQRQLSSNYRKSFLGFLWIVLTPLLMIALYTLVFSEVVGLRFRQAPGVANFGLYLYCGLIPFLALTEAINKSVGSIRGNSNLVQKVVFPTEILPLSTTITGFISSMFGLGVLITLVGILERELHWTMALLPVVMAVQLVMALGASYLMAVAGAYLPDLKEVTSAFMRAMFFATPIIWPPELAYDAGLGFLVDYNPLAFLVMSYRDVVLNGQIPGATPVLWWSLFAVTLVVGGFLLFVTVKKRFPDLI